MERGWLEARLGAGRSIESIAAEVDRDPSTVAYWVNKYGLVSSHASKHAARGDVDRDVLEALVAEGLSLRAMAERLGISYTSVRHWMKKHGLETPRARRLKAGAEARKTLLPVAEIECTRHGLSAHVLRPDQTSYRCVVCRVENVTNWRRSVKAILVAEAGGACVLCGYSKYLAALQFHHLDRDLKEFSLSGGGVTRSLMRLREEARKCVLLCANCHAAVEAGLERLPSAA